MYVDACLTQLPGLRDSERERNIFRDQLDEWRPLVELSKRQETQLEKYRERLDEVAEMRRELQTLRAEKAQRSVPTHTEDKEASSKRAERKYAVLQEQHARLEQEHAQLRAQYEERETERAKQMEQQNLAQRGAQTDEPEEAPKSDVASPDNETIVSLREEISRLQSQLEHTKLMPDTDSLSDSPARHESHLAAVHADITAMRNNARSKEKEAQYVDRLILGPSYGNWPRNMAQKRTAIKDQLVDPLQKSFVPYWTCSLNRSNWMTLSFSVYQNAGNRPKRYVDQAHADAKRNHDRSPSLCGLTSSRGTCPAIDASVNAMHCAESCG